MTRRKSFIGYSQSWGAALLIIGLLIAGGVSIAIAAWQTLSFLAASLAGLFA